MTDSRALRGAGVSVLLVMVGWLAPAGALAAGKPIVTTGAVADIAQSTVTLTGSVNPNRAATTYFFQYGTTSLYGAQSTPTRATRRGRVTAPVGGLAPATTYHYRLVAQNRLGLTKGKDRTFKTRRQPLGLVLAATPNPVGIGRPTILSGTLSGTGNAGRAVVLQANPFPYVQGFQNVTNAQVTNALGQFAFTLLSVPLNTQYRVVMTSRPDVVSPIVAVGVAVRVSTHVRRHRTRHRTVARFSGTVTPARDGAQFAIQRLRNGAWVTVNGGVATHAAGGVSRYSKRVRIRHSGFYRVFVGSVGDFVSNVGRTVHIRR